MMIFVLHELDCQGEIPNGFLDMWVQMNMSTHDIQCSSIFHLNSVRAPFSLFITYGITSTFKG
jgi:hypothetical protein